MKFIYAILMSAMLIGQPVNVDFFVDENRIEITQCTIEERVAPAIFRSAVVVDIINGEIFLEINDGNIYSCFVNSESDIQINDKVEVMMSLTGEIYDFWYK